MIRRAETDADFAFCADVCNVVDPHANATAAALAQRKGASALLLDERGGYALVDRSSVVGTVYTMVRVRPEARGAGIGSALLEAAGAETRALQLARQWGRVDAEDVASLAFVARRGFHEVAREPTLVLNVQTAAGEIGPAIAELGPEHLPSAYEVAVECVPEIALPQSAAVPPYEEWVERETKNSPVAFAAFNGDRVVGFARLYEVGDQLENGLTAVRQSHRRRGIALALKRAQIAWARERGYREITTSSVAGNVAMRTVNERLGYRPLREFVVVEGVSG